MKKQLQVLFLMAIVGMAGLFPQLTKAQCNSNEQYGGIRSAGSFLWNYVELISPGQFAKFDVSGVYTWSWVHFSLCPEHGGYANYDSQLTLRNATTDEVLAYSDDFCGLNAKISWQKPAGFNDMLKLVVSKYYCQAEFNPGTIAYFSSYDPIPPLPNVNPLFPGLFLYPDAGTMNIDISSNTYWSISYMSNWFTVTNLSGHGSGNSSIIYEENPNNHLRTGTITFSAPGMVDKTYTITQFWDDGYCNSTFVPDSSSVREFSMNHWKHLFLHAGRAEVFSVIEGQQYHWTTCHKYGGESYFGPSVLTLRRTDDHNHIATSVWACNSSMLTWTADFTGTVRLIVNGQDCSNQSICFGYSLAYLAGPLADQQVTIVSSNVVELSPGADTAYFEIHANTKWRVSYDNNGGWAWHFGWPYIDRHGNAILKIAVSQNNTGQQRVAKHPVKLMLGGIGGGCSSIYETVDTLTIIQHPNDGYCNSTIKYGGVLTPQETWLYHNFIYPGEYSVYEVEAGNQYHWSMCEQHYGMAAYDSELTLRNAADNSFITYADDVCGNDARISWVANFTGQVKLVLSKYQCQSDNISSSIAYKRGALANPFLSFNPTTATIGPQAGSVTFNLQSNTSWTLSHNSPWISSVSPSSGSGNALITVYYEANTGSNRTAIITGNAPGVPASVFTLNQTDYCSSTAQYGTIIPNDNWQLFGGIWAGEYTLVYVEQGYDYHFSLCSQHGGNAQYDSQLTLRRNDNNAFLAYSDDNCGNDALISWTADFTGWVRLVVSVYNCGANQVETTFAYKRGTLMVPYITLTPQHQNVNPMEGTVVYQINSNAYWSLGYNDNWLSGPVSGAGDANITINYGQNNQFSERTAIITATAPAAPQAQATLTQYAFCNSNAQHGSLFIPTQNWQFVEGIHPGNYALFAVEAGIEYHWSTCPAHGGLANYISELTLRREADNSVITFAAENCNTTNALLSWTADFTGNVKLVLTRQFCHFEPNSSRLAFIRGALQTPYLSVNPVIKTVHPYAFSTTVNVLSNSTWIISGGESWITSVSPLQGSGNATITLTGLANNEGDHRYASFVAYSPTNFQNFHIEQVDYCMSYSQFGAAQTPNNNWQYVENIFPGEYAVFNVTAGQHYIWSLCETDGAWADYDAQLTLRSEADNTILSYSDDVCGSKPRLSWTASITGQVKLVITKFHCQPDWNFESVTRLAYKSGSYESPYLTLTPSNQSVHAPSGSIDFTINSNTYWVISTNDAWISSVNPQSGNGNDVITVFYDLNSGAERTATLDVQTFVNNLTAQASLTQHATMPASLHLSNLIFTEGQSECYNASQTILLAGFGSTFVVQNGADVEAIAGEKVVMLPGFHAQEGSYFRAGIGSETGYCEQAPPLLATQQETPQHPEKDEELFVVKNQNFRVYPNPTNGIFALAFDEVNHDKSVVVEVYNLHGQLIMSKQIQSGAIHQFDLSDKQSGIYILRLIQNNASQTIRVVKQ